MHLVPSASLGSLTTKALRGGTRTVGLSGTLINNLAGQVGKEGPGVKQIGVAKVVKTTLREDLSTTLEPHRLIELNTSVLVQQLSHQQLRVPNIVQQVWINLASQ